MGSGPEPHSQHLVNGRPESRLAVLDRGLTYGDGVFRTLRIRQGAPRWWTEQWAALVADGARLGIDVPPECLWLADLGCLDLPKDGVARLTVTRGTGHRGYRAVGLSDPTRIISVWAAPPLADGPASIEARLCDLRLSHQPALAGIKHLNRLENVMARREWNASHIQEGILLDQAGNLVSGVMSNLFLRRGDTLLTPALDHCGVAGVTRARLMALAPKAGYRVEETRLDLPALLEAEEVMFTNSVFVLWHLARLGDRAWPEPVASHRLWKLLNA
ncbi:MAG: aminodeoxychorismate lyase [Pseudomonadota bacterium]